MRNKPRSPIRGKRDLRLVLPFVIIFLGLVLLSSFSIDLLSAARAFVGGESLWSKGQKAAVIHLMRYANGGDEEEFLAYQRAIAVPLGDRQARVELARERPDYRKAAEGLLEGGNHPDDVPGMIRLVRYFGRLPAIDRALEIWARGDNEVATLNQLAFQLHDAVRAGHNSAAELAPLLQGIRETDARVTPLEEAFSSSLGEISRRLRDFLIPGIGIVAASLLFPGVALVLRDVRRERRHSLRLAHLATHDSLTGLFNRSEFERRLSTAIDEAHQNGSTHALMYLDLDQFKVVNDTCGHAGGDELIRQIGALMRAQLRQTDTLARLGGDEFGVLLEHCAPGDNERLAEAIRNAISSFQFVYRHRTFSLGVSIGVINLDQTVTKVAEALSAADAACYLAKQNGRNRVQVYQLHDDAIQVFHGEMEWVSRVHTALAEERFCLYSQEITPLQNSSRAGRHIELLLRMVDEAGLMVTPMEFIPACERYNLMPMLDRWVIGSAFAELAGRNAAAPRDIAVCSINLSGASLADSSMPAYIQECAAQHGIPLNTICFEITETAAVGNLEQAARFIRDLQSLGCTFALDDFGAGMSSFTYLKHLPAEYIKIDGTFITEMFDLPVNLAVIEAIQRISRATGQMTIAEWVDSGEKLLRLRALGVDYAQGYQIGRPEHFTGRQSSSHVASGHNR